jgi:hypothetical protein
MRTVFPDHTEDRLKAELLRDRDRRLRDRLGARLRQPAAGS